jgi:hypothetical protein
MGVQALAQREREGLNLCDKNFRSPLASSNVVLHTYITHKANTSMDNGTNPKHQQVKHGQTL